MDKELKRLIEDFFYEGQSKRIIKLIEDKGKMNRDPNDTNYRLIRRAFKRLETARELLKYPEIQLVLKNDKSIDKRTLSAIKHLKDKNVLGDKFKV